MAANTTLKKITTRAKEIRRKRPGMKYTNAVKEAANQLKREGKIGKVKQRKTVVRKSPAIKRKRIGSSSKTSSASKKVRSELRKEKLRMPHGYAVSKRKLSGIGSMHRVRTDIERAIKEYNDNKDFLRREKPKGYQVKINMLEKRLSILKKQLTEQNKLIRTLL